MVACDFTRSPLGRTLKLLKLARLGRVGRACLLRRSFLMERRLGAAQAVRVLDRIPQKNWVVQRTSRTCGFEQKSTLANGNPRIDGNGDTALELLDPRGNTTNLPCSLTIRPLPTCPAVRMMSPLISRRQHQHQPHSMPCWSLLQSLLREGSAANSPRRRLISFSGFRQQTHPLLKHLNTTQHRQPC